MTRSWLGEAIIFLFYDVKNLIKYDIRKSMVDDAVELVHYELPQACVQVQRHFGIHLT